MKRFFERAVKSSLALVLSLGTLSFSGLDVSANTKDYEIYPVPHEISYQDGEYIIRPEVNVVYEKGIDEVTKNRLAEILASKGKEVTVSDAKAEGKTNVLVGTYGSNEYVDSYVEAKYDVDASVFGRFGGHYVISNDGEIAVIGSDSDAAFYGLTSLKHIFNQIDGSTIRNFIIKDYADTNTRGFIEGYYGIPWSNEDRMSLMRFGGDFKMTSYVFAPKDDPYHSAKWREPYPADKLAEISEMALVGNEAKCRFVWTIHPFMRGGITEASYDADIEKIKTKFDQLYDAGVRQFGVLGDDAGNLPRSVVIRVMNDLQEWVDEKGDVYNLVFCPGGYNDAWQGNYSELNEYDEGFHQDIQIFWTGQAVCQPIEQRTLDNFRRKNLPEGKEQRRSPLFWLNWPVNDINMSRLMMGKGSLLHTDITIDDLSGAVTNPMQDAQASKVALFAVADFTWNVKGFNDDKSWEDSFKYIDPDASEELHTLAKHMSDPSPNNHGLVLGESEELKPLLDSFMESYENGTLDLEKANALINEFTKIRKACVDFHALSKNEGLKAELLPFTMALNDLSLANILFIKTAIALDEGNTGEVWSNYSSANAVLSASQNYDRITIGGTKKALPASKRIRPFANKMNQLLTVPVNAMIDDSKVMTSLITNRTDTPEGALEKLTDNDTATQVIWSNPNSVTEGTYIGLSFSKTIALKDVTFKMGQSGNPRDTFQSAKLQYSEDGKTWIDIAGSEYSDRRGEVIAENLTLKVKGIRLVATADQSNMWLGCKDIIVNASENLPEEPEELVARGIYNTENMVICNGNLDMITDGVDDKNGSYVGFRKSNTGADRDTIPAGAWVGVEFEQPTMISSITFSQGTGDHIDEGRLEYSVDGETWEVIGTFNGIGADFVHGFTFNPLHAKAIRLVNTADKAIWWRIYEIKAVEYVEDHTPLNKSIIKSDTWSIYSGSENNLTDGNDNTGIWYDTGSDDTTKVGDFIGMDLGKIVRVGKVSFVVGQGDGDKWDEYHLEFSADNENWIPVKSYVNAGSGKFVHEEFLGGIRARYVRIVNDKEKKAWVKFGEFNVEQYVNGTSEYTYTNVDALKKLQALHETNEIHLVNTPTVTLKPNEYFGFKLERIKDITAINTNIPSDVTLQTSKNGLIWTTVSDGEQYEDARYIRVINLSDTDKLCDSVELSVESLEYAPISMIDKNINFYSGGDGLNAFDHNRTTEVIFNHSQIAGDFVTYDLGQTIDLNSIALVSKDSAGDFPRHAKLSVSLDGETWTPVLLIGDQEKANPGEAEGTDNIMDVLPVHDVSSNLKKAEGLNQKIRFVKFEITRTKVGPDKWTRYTEIEINGGNLFLLSENNPTIVSTSKQSEGNVLTNMIDGEASTTYQAKEDTAGSFTYYLSDHTDITKLNILSSISTATVSVKALVGATVKEVVLGKLQGSVNEFDTSSFTNVLEVKVTWEKGEAPEIYEIITSNAAPEAVDKEGLRAYYENNKALDTNTWTRESGYAYVSARNRAKEVLANEYMTQTMVDDALKSLQHAVNNKLLKGDASVLEKALSEVLTEEEAYTPSTWRAYAKAVVAAKNALEEKDNITDEMIASYIEAIDNAEAALVYNPANKELAILTLEAEKAFIASIDSSIYTEGSWNAYISTVEALETLLNGEDMHPSVYVEALEKMKDAKETLKMVDKDAVALAKLVEDVKAMDLSQYTSNSVETLRSALKDAEKALVSEDAAAIDQASEALNKALKGLVVKANAETVIDYVENIKSIDYGKNTEESVKAYKEALKVLEDMLTRLDNLSCEEFLNAKDAFEKAKANLVEISDDKETEEKPSEDDSVDSGDKTDTTSLYILLGLSLVAIGGFVVYKKKKSK